ncbi:major capsid protein [Nocardia jinanensis]|uniref:Capsid protein n=1 Tax=Nocardia jinanensis TaxID=382504 RepID=A0A917RI89_9NOCA|nr:major capsid protein [Nocardia jinanensis]GGL09676.1 hypothetical protein GCM10011588_25080 [Nocardia jinanensis]
MGILTPSVDNNIISVSAVLSHPTWIRAKLDELAEGNELVSLFFSPHGKPVQGGGILHPRLSSAARYTADDVVERAPGDEYQAVRAIDPEYRLAAVRDYGAKVSVTDEEIARGDISALNNKMLQLSNTLLRKLNVKALEAIDAAGPASLVATAAWDTFVTVGPDTGITPNAERPLADMMRARLAAEQDRLGITLDTLVTSPQDATNLSIGYGVELTQVLAAARLTLVTNPYIPEGRVYLTAKGKAGTVGFEAPLTVDIIDKRENREKIVQVYAVPAYAVDRPQAVKVVTGTVTP